MHTSTARKPETNTQKQAFLSTIDLLHAQNSTQWRWVDCPYFLKTFPQENVISYLNLTPFQKCSQLETQAQTLLDINLEKSLKFHPNLGWNWHKSWILPEINVKLSQYATKTRVFAKLFVVKAGLEYSENFFLVDIGVKGCSKSYVQNQIAVFRNLKFSSTSYNNEGLKFHLVVVVFEENDEESQNLDSNYKIIDSKLSPPIYVDSRKSAREICFKENTFLDMFHPDLLSKPLFKKRRKNVDKKEEFISNSLKGFINYYTAPNIRNKIKHPFFIALKFSSCVTLYYNKNFFNKGSNFDNIKEILSFLQQYNENLSKIYAKKKKTKIFLNKTSENAYLAIHIKNPNQIIFSKKVSEFLGSFDKRIIKIVLEKQELAEKYAEISDLSQLKQIYNDEFDKNNEKEENNSEKLEFLIDKKSKKNESFEPLLLKKLKVDSSSQCSEVQPTDTKPQFIPEITTLIEINTIIPLSKKAKEPLLKINPEELFKSILRTPKLIKEKSEPENCKENNEKAISEPTGQIKIVDAPQIKIEKSYKSTDDESYKNKRNNNSSPHLNNLNNYPGFLGHMNNMMLGDMNPGYYYNPGMMENMEYMNGMIQENMFRNNMIPNQYNYEEYKIFLEKMETYMNNKQRLDFILLNNMFLNK